MEQDKLRFNVTPESALLVKTLRDRHRYSTTEEQKHEKNKFGWIACKDFTAEEGKRQIGEYIKSWDIQPCWIYSLDFLCSNEDEDHCVFYHYRARFSTPTPHRPIQGTASVYFTVAVSEALTPDMVFVIESCRFVQEPGERTRGEDQGRGPGERTFREERLVEVIQDKALLLGGVDL